MGPQARRTTPLRPIAARPARSRPPTWGVPGLVLVLLLMATVVAPVGEAHAPPRAPSHFARLLTDVNDDCGHTPAGCAGSVDLLALDVREAYVAGEGMMLVFRLVMAPGEANGTHAVTLGWSTSGQTARMQVEATQNLSMDGWSAPGTYRTEGPYPVFEESTEDEEASPGDRFAIELWYGYARLGLAEGARIYDFELTAHDDNETRDVMPGTWERPNGTRAPSPPNEAHTPTEHEELFYELRGAAHYLDVSGPPVFDVEAGTSQSFTLIVTNLLRDVDQQATIRWEAPENVTVRGGASNPDHPEESRMHVGARESMPVHVVIAAPPGLEDLGDDPALRFVVTSDIGAYSEYRVPLRLIELDDGDEEATNGSRIPEIPALSMSLSLFALIASVLLVRARRRSG